MQPKSSILTSHALKIDLKNRLLWVDAEQSKLVGKPFDLLALLMSKPKHLLKKEDIIAVIWDGRFVSDDALTGAIKTVRLALGDQARKPFYIETVHGQGYRFLQDVDHEKAADDADDAEISGDHTSSKLTKTSIFAFLALALITAVFASGVFTKSIDRSIAVLPFDDLSENASMKWFADGVAEEILNSLAKSPDIFVSSRNASFRYADTNFDMKTIGAELGVAYLLEGSVRREEKRIRVTAQLIRAADGFHVWSQNYDRVVGSLIDIQEDIALRVAEVFDTATSPEALQQMVRAGTRSIAAYQAFLEARQYEQKFTKTLSKDDWAKAFKLHETARELDPGFAEAHSRAAAGWYFSYSRSLAFNGIDLAPEAFLAGYLERINGAIKAAGRDSYRALYEARRAEILFQLSEARDLYQQFLGAYPANTVGIFGLSNVLNMMGDFEAQRRVLDGVDLLVKGDNTNATILLQHYLKARDFKAGIGFYRSLPYEDQSQDWMINNAYSAFRWAGDHKSADGIIDLLESKGKSPASLRMRKVQSLCAAGDREAALQLLGRPLEDFKGERPNIGVLMLFGEEEAVYRALQKRDRSAPPVMLKETLYNHSIDRARLPGTAKLILQAGGKIPAPLPLPYRCS